VKSCFERSLCGDPRDIHFHLGVLVRTKLASLLTIAALSIASPALAKPEQPQGSSVSAEKHQRNADRKASQSDKPADKDTPKAGKPSDAAVKPAKPEANPNKPKARPGKPGSADATSKPGNSGTIKISAVDSVADPSNEPHPGCSFRVDFYGFRAGTFDVTVSTQPPTGREVLLTDVVTLATDARGNELQLQKVYDVASMLPASDDGRWHLRVDVARQGQPGNGSKTKVFWLECPTDGTAAEQSFGSEADGFAADALNSQSQARGARNARVLSASASQFTAEATADDAGDGAVVQAAAHDALALTGSPVAKRVFWAAIALLIIGVALTLFSRRTTGGSI
jgi:hypothetical protein